MKSWRKIAVCSVILLLALSIRTVGLGSRSFWHDEGFSARMAESFDPELWARDAHPPLYYALLSVWSWPAGSDFWLRLFSVLFGVMTIPLVYAIGKRMFSVEAGFWSAVVLSFLQIHIRYSQEARMYTLMTFLFAGALWGVVNVTHEGRVRAGWIAYVMCSVLLCYSHAIGVLYWMTLAVALLALMACRAQGGIRWSRYVMANAVVLILFAPWAPILLARAHRVIQSFWIPEVEPTLPVRFILYDFVLKPVPQLKGILSRHFGVPVSIVPSNGILILPIIGLMLMGILSQSRSIRKNLAVMWLTMLLPVVSLFLFSVTTRPLLIIRAVLPTVVPFALLFGASRCVSRVWRRPAAALLAIFMIELLIGAACYLRSPEKEGWNAASLYLQEQAGGGESSLAVGSFIITRGLGKYLLKRYDPRGRLNAISWTGAGELRRPDGSITKDRFQEVLGELPDTARIWAVERRSRRRGPIREALAEFLQERDKKVFRGISVTEFVWR